LLKDKAYKVLAQQERISNGEAKKLIDTGLVFLKGKRVNIARVEVPVTTKFRVNRIEKLKRLFEDEKVIAVNKPAFIDSEEVERKIDGSFLLHRLDRDTSGILLLSRDRDFQKEVIETFKKREVYKEYIAWVSGRVVEPLTIEKKLKREKRGGKIRTVVSKDGDEAITKVEPLLLSGNRSKIKIIIETGRTHQIRVHLADAGFPIFGDRVYGGAEFDRLMLHSKKIEIFDYKLEAEEPKIFEKFING
jgi:23S rRNA pseudouridine1911/1915/1917 synthase